MRLPVLIVAAALGLAIPAQAHDRSGAHPRQVAIQIHCFRGPWREIIWDRPEVSFTDDLVAVGYSQSEALAIGTRICRDPEGVQNPGHLVDVLRQILRTERPRR